MDIAHERLLQLVSYNPETGIFMRKKGRGKGGIAGTLEKRGWLVIGVDNLMYRAHRLAWFYMTGEWPSQQIDHINNSRADNRWCNLRQASHHENARNKSKHRNNTSGVTGVWFSKTEKKWRAYIMRDGKLKIIGRFVEKDAAIEARQKAEKEVYGEFSHKIAA